MATNKDLDSEVIFKEKVEEKEIKGERATKDNTIRFDSRASTPAASPPGRGMEARTGDGKKHRRVEVKKFSRRPEKYEWKVDFEG